MEGIAVDAGSKAVARMWFTNTKTKNISIENSANLSVRDFDLALVNLDDFDFIDYGCSTGGAISVGVDYLGGRRGFGVDINRQKVAQAREAGYEAFVGDFCNLDLPSKCVDFVILSHVLEHLPRFYLAQKALKSAMRVARKFVYVRGPYFDCERELSKLGFKFYWGDWHGHTCHFTVDDFRGTLELLEHEQFEIYGRDPIKTSGHPGIHPLSSPPEQQDYDPSIHPPKGESKFKFPAFKEFVGIIWLSPDADPNPVRNFGDRQLLAKSGSWYPIC